MDIFREPIIPPTTEPQTKNDDDFKSLAYLIQCDSLEMITGSVLIDSLKIKGSWGEIILSPDVLTSLFRQIMLFLTLPHECL